MVTAEVAATRRAVLAAIALSDLPQPRQIVFSTGANDEPMLVLDLDSTGAAIDWLAFVDGQEREGIRYISSATGQPRVYAVTEKAWMGWRVYLAGEDLVPPDSLDAEVRGRLVELVDEREPDDRTGALLTTANTVDEELAVAQGVASIGWEEPVAAVRGAFQAAGLDLIEVAALDVPELLEEADRAIVVEQAAEWAKNHDPGTGDPWVPPADRPGVVRCRWCGWPIEVTQTGLWVHSDSVMGPTSVLCGEGIDRRAEPTPGGVR